MKNNSITLLFVLLISGIGMIFSAEPPDKNETPKILDKLEEAHNLFRDEPAKIYDTEDFFKLRNIVHRNYDFVIENWSKTEIAGKKQEILLNACLYSKYPLYDKNNLHSDFSIKDYVDFLSGILPVLKKAGRKELFYLPIDDEILTFNYTTPRIMNILDAIIASSDEWGFDSTVEKYSNIKAGKTYFDRVKYMFLTPPADGSIRRPLNTYLYGNADSEKLLLLSSIYARGLVAAEDGRKNNIEKKLVRGKNKLRIGDVISCYASVPDQLTEDYGTYEENNAEYDMAERALENDQKWIDESTCAEAELLKMLGQNTLSEEKKLMIVHLLWNGVYSSDQLFSFLPMLKNDSSQIRAMAYNSMPEWLKNGINYNPQFVIKDEQFRQMRDRIVKQRNAADSSSVTIIK